MDTLSRRSVIRGLFGASVVVAAPHVVMAATPTKRPADVEWIREKTVAAWIAAAAIDPDLRQEAAHVMGRFGLQKFKADPLHDLGCAAQGVILQRLGRLIRAVDRVKYPYDGGEWEPNIRRFTHPDPVRLEKALDWMWAKLQNERLSIVG